jgi:hypothetical protein
MKVYRSSARVRLLTPAHIDQGYWAEQPQNISVYEDDTPRDTGLLDVRGNPIICAAVIGPIGFGRE